MLDDAYGSSPVACGDCGAALQEAPTSSRLSPVGRPPKGGRSVWRCPWATRDRHRIDHAETSLLIVCCRWPKGWIDQRSRPLSKFSVAVGS
jgi:hypothetical protein